MKKTLLYIVLFLPFEALCQFNGGNGDGQSQNTYGGFMNGQGTTIFAGGSSDGTSMFYSEALLSVSCVSSITVDGNPINPDEYQSLEFIDSKGSVNANTEVVFKTGRSITLKKGFLAESNSLFIAEIDFCISQPTNY